MPDDDHFMASRVSMKNLDMNGCRISGQISRKMARLIRWIEFRWLGGVLDPITLHGPSFVREDSVGITRRCRR